MVSKYRVTLYAAKWDGRNIAEVEEIAGMDRVSWEGSSADGVVMQILFNSSWELLPVGSYLTRDINDKLSIVPAEEFESVATLVNSNTDINEDIRRRKAYSEHLKMRRERRRSGVPVRLPDDDDDDDDESDAG